jgi:hypothetical protein
MPQAGLYYYYNTGDIRIGPQVLSSFGVGGTPSGDSVLLTKNEFEESGGSVLRECMLAFYSERKPSDIYDKISSSKRSKMLQGSWMMLFGFDPEKTKLYLSSNDIDVKSTGKYVDDPDKWVAFILRAIRRGLKKRGLD